MALYKGDDRERELRKIVRQFPEMFAETFRITPRTSVTAKSEAPWEDDESFPNRIQLQFWLYGTAKDSKFGEFDRPTAKETKARLNCFIGLLKKGTKRSEQMLRVNHLQVIIAGALRTLHSRERLLCSSTSEVVSINSTGTTCQKSLSESETNLFPTIIEYSDTNEVENISISDQLNTYQYTQHETFLQSINPNVSKTNLVDANCGDTSNATGHEAKVNSSATHGLTSSNKGIAAEVILHQNCDKEATRSKASTITRKRSRPSTLPRRKLRRTRLTKFERDCKENGDPVYDFEEIVAHKHKGGDLAFLVKWKDYADSANTWEPRDSFEPSNLVDYFIKHSEKDLADTIRQKQSELTKIDKKSMQTKLLPDGSRAKYECPVCNQCMFGKTNVLAEICGHVVCKACVIGVIDTNYYHCPKCRIGNISKQIPVFIEEPTYNLGEDSSEDENVS